MFAHLQSRQNGFIEKVKLFNLAKENKDFIQRLKLDYKVEAHTGCVNTLCWSSSGQNILSGSDDQHLVITDPFKRKTVTSIRSGHRANIFSAKYLPFTGDNQIISCSGDGKIYYTKVGTGDQHEASLFDCHFGTTYEVIVVPNEASTFLSCGEDGTVRWFDLRIKTSCLKEDCKDDVLINCRRAVTSLAINPVLQYQLAIGCSDSSVRIFDRRMLGTRSSGHYTGRGLTGMICSFTAPNLASRSHRITSLSYSPNGGDVLVSYSSEYVYLFGTNDNRVKHYDKMFSKVEKCVERQSDPKPPQPAIQRPSTSNVIPLSSTSNLAALPSTSRPPPLPPKAPPKAQSTTTSLLAAASSAQASGGATEEEGYVQALTSEAYADDQPEMSRQPPFKRLRMRGDWSDTGPNARPEAERNTEGRVRPPSIMQRMSDMLTRWLDGNLRRTTGSTGEDQQETPQVDEGMDSSTPHIPPSDQSQPGVSTEETIEMEGIVSGWSDMPSTSVSDCVGTNTDPTVCDETEHSEGQSVTSQENISDVPESRSNPELTEIPSVSDNTHICDNSSDSRLSEDNSNIQQTSSVNSDNDQDSNREETHLEPVISLHYATEGTTSSTIRLGFARFENLEAGILQRSAENASLSPLVTESASNQDQSSVLEDNVVQEASRITEDIDSHDSDRVQENNNPNSESIQAENTHTIITGSELEQNTKLEVSEETAQHTLSKPSQTDTLSDNTIQEQSEDETRINETQSQPEVASPDEDMHDSSTWGQHSEERLDTPSMSSPISHLHIRPGSETDPGSLEGAESQMDTDIDSAQPPPLPRHRRIGRSGPSMGNIHLGLEMDNSDEEHEEETGGTRPTNRDSLERHITAIKLQELYRKRQEEKEKEEMEMRNVYRPSFKMKFKGHRNARTMIKEANFWGDDYVMSGSDCGHIFIWDRHTARLVMLLEGDRHVVNCLQPHPYDPILASSGIDYDIKIWAPLEECTNFNEDVSNEIMSRNEIMLEETRDTITVPAAFMLRVLASLNQIRAGRASVSRPSQEQGSSDSE